MKDGMKTVYVGMSGGVDSSLTAALLIEQGFNVVGVYMKNWAKDLPGFECPWREDLADAKRVAVQLGIKLEIFDFQDGYKSKVVDYMLDSYKLGITPNPDIMCNQEIKFKLFLDTALEKGADMIATGHYARVENGQLMMAADRNKDQTYFLYRVTQEALSKTLFPLGDLTKSQVRKMAAERGLVTADKKESMGICFVGKVGIKEFLGQYVKTQTGDILNQDGQTLGKHDGAIFYTIGQRHGLELGGGLPYYVVDKDMKTNTVTVTTDIDDERLWSQDISLVSFHSISDPPKPGSKYMVRARHRAELIEAELVSINGDSAEVSLKDPSRAITPGQSLVFYEKDQVVGGGIIGANS